MMVKLFVSVIIGGAVMVGFLGDFRAPVRAIAKSQTVDSLGAGQGVAVHGNSILLYGDREVGVLRQYKMQGDTLVYVGRETKLTIHDTDLINHPTGIAYQEGQPVFIGNSIRLNAEGTKWKAVIYLVDWKKLLQQPTLDGALLHTIDDDTCIQGTRPEYVKYKNKWYVATADYGPARNEVRLYEPAALAKADRTSKPGVCAFKFTCSPWVQNLWFNRKDNKLVLVQNQIEGRRWKLSWIDLDQSIAKGKEVILDTVVTDRADELEGFAMSPDGKKGIAVTSARTNNVNIME
ncbi:MAG: hypothetical protein EOP49_40250 [Sphingobacteriales bacterium]|nr:MAG: hypothetical protein EOP49_40250 [Sphingobacteriales bacterium]